MENSDTRNLILALVLCTGIIFGWQTLILDPQAKKAKAEREAAQAELNLQAGNVAQGGQATDSILSDNMQLDVPMDALNSEDSRENILKRNARINFDGPGVHGSISIRGARLDDLDMKRHFVELDSDIPVRLMNPQQSEDAYYAAMGWILHEDSDLSLVNARTPWQRIDGDMLTPETPVTLRFYDRDIEVRRKIEMDENYLFTITDQIINHSNEEISVHPYGVLRRFGLPEDLQNFFILHEGLIGVMDGKLIQEKYKKLAQGKDFTASTNEGGWIGFTEKYWMGALIPEQLRPFSVSYKLHRQGEGVLETRFDGQTRLIAPGGDISVTNRVFAGAKRLRILEQYQKAFNIPRFNDAVDWGNFWFLTKPFFYFLQIFQGLTGNFGFAILLLTIVVKAVFYPIQNKAYESMSRMKKLQEPMEQIRAQFKDDKQRMQQEIIALYQKEKVNPVAGCLPILIQIPVFYALYKTLFVTLEMRHEPFIGWVRDLSAPDPTAIGNLFGLLPIDLSGIESVFLIGSLLTIGIWPLLYGLTMWALQSLNPPPPDEMQRMIFGMLPIVFTFILAQFAVGLLIYWTWSNVLSILQQYMIMRKNGVETQLDKWISRRFGKA